MSMSDEGADVVGPGADATAGGPPAGPPPGAGPPGPPGGGGGPIVAALAQRQGKPGVSAPGPGDTASAMTMLMQAVGMIQQALPGLPPGSPMHKDALRAVTTLSRHANQGQPTAGVQLTQMQDLLRNITKSGLLQHIMGRMGQAGGGGGPPGGPPGGGGAPAPMPSTPMPGA